LLFFFQAEDGIRDRNVTGVQTCALPISYRLGQNEDGIFSDSTALQKLTSYAQLFNMDKESGLEISESTPQVSDSMPIPSAIGQRSEERRVGKGCRARGATEPRKEDREVA